jgi:glycosyltransferase involved in cell wall biosynthesis
MAEPARPLVSVVIPTYNMADLLPDAVATVQAQRIAATEANAEADVEIVIADDGSTDHTPQVVAGLNAPHVHHVRSEVNRGIGFGKCFGVENAAGQYIAMLDADDVWLPGKLAAQVAALQAHPEIDILFTDFVNIDHVRNVTETGFSVARAGLARLAAEHVEGDLWRVKDGLFRGILAENFIGASSLVFHRRTIERYGNFDPSLRRVEDVEFYCRTSVHGAQYGYLNRPYHERHTYSFSSTVNVAFHAEYKLKALEQCRQVCRDAGRDDLIAPIRQATARTCRKLILHYGERAQRRDAVRVFRYSLGLELSPRTMLFLVLALLGPAAVRTLRNARAQDMADLTPANETVPEH